MTLARFNPALPISTAAVLVVDEQTRLSEPALDSLFARWRFSAKQLVRVVKYQWLCD